MAKSLEEYAAQHPQQAPDREQRAVQEAAKTYQDRQQERERITKIKDSITYQLEKGNPPQYILYPALEAIGILTDDADWAEAGKQALDRVYADLAQQSIFTDDAAAAAQRLDAMQEEYNEKTRHKLMTQLNGCRRIEKALNDALDAIFSLESEMQELQEPEQI